MRAPDNEGVSIVMIGSFNPAIFQPRWLGAQQLIRPEEAENAKITIIHNEVADFSTEWFQVQVLQNRLQFVCTDPRHYPPLRDLGAAVFALLPHTPVKALGLNRFFHFKMPSIESWHGLGHRLAPKDIWSPLMTNPGLRSMLMEGRRHETGGILRIKVEPSPKAVPGIYLEINEEFTASEETAKDATWVPDCLGRHWDAIMEFSEAAAEHLLSLAR